MFAKFFKPKWQHSKADVRIRAITKLKASNSEQRQILSQLALQDQNPAVRSAAVIKLDEPELLCKISNLDTDHQVRHLAADRACRMIIEPQNNNRQDNEQQDLLQQRINSIQQLQDDNILTHIALNVDDYAVQQVAISKIQDQTCLGTLTLKASHTQIRKAAAEKLREENIIEQLCKETRSKDKTVHRIIRNKLRDIREQAKIRQQHVMQQQEVTTALRQLLSTGYYPQFDAKLNAYRKTAEALLKAEHNQTTDPAASQALRDALTSCCQLATAEQEKARLLRQQQQEKEQQQAAWQLLVNNYQTLLNSTGIAINYSETASLQTELKTLQHQQSQLSSDWQSFRSAANAAEFTTFDKQITELDQQLTKLFEACQRFCQQQEQLSALLNSDSDSLQADLQNSLKTINWPELNNITQPKLLSSARQRIQQLREEARLTQQLQKQDQAAQLSQLDSYLQELEQALGAGHSKQAYKLDKQLQELFESKQYNKASRQRYSNLQQQLQQLKDWQGFAVIPKKEALCEAMEGLINSPLEATELADNIRLLQQQWKDLDATDPYHSHELWKRFKRASDSAYEPCSKHYAELKQQRTLNLQQRLLLCDQLEALIAATDWEQPDWQEIEQISRTAKQEWRQYTPVDRTPGREAQNRFNATLKLLDGKIKAYREANADTKQALTDQAGQLCQQAEQTSQPEELPELLKQVKQLQLRWRDTGNSFHSVERKLWPLFRQACNRVYDLEKRSRKSAQSQQNQLNKLEQICEQLEALQLTPAGNQQSQELIRHAEELLASQPETPEAIQQRLHSAKSFLQRQQQQLNQLLESDSYQAWQRKVSLCEQLEEKLLAGELDNKSLQQLQEAWRQGEQPDNEYAELLETRFSTACDIYQGSQELDPVIYQSDAALRQLCIQLEIAFNQSSPEEDQALRLEYQMQRLQQALEDKDSSISLQDLKQLEMEWLCQPFARHQESLFQRFYGILQQVF